MKAFIINGQGGAGKDQFVTFIRDILSTKYMFPAKKTVNVSSVAEIKEIAEKYFGWQGEKTPEWRKALSDLKDIQTRMCNGPFLYMLEQFKAHEDTDCVMFFHIREPSEIERFAEWTGAETILINRPELSRNYGNHADDKVKDYEYTYYIENDTDLENLKESAHNFIINVIRA